MKLKHFYAPKVMTLAFPLTSLKTVKLQFFTQDDLCHFTYACNVIQRHTVAGLYAPT